MKKIIELYDNAFYFRMIKLRSKHSSFKHLQDPNCFKVKLEVNDKKILHYQEKDGELV
ncbi:hypothetical protein UXU46_00320 (plasmid) [Campylobacter jejuni]